MLEIVGGKPDQFPSPPYPATTRAESWKFDLDISRIKQSDTWTLARPEIRPWLLMLWMTAWEQCPCGSLPADDTLISALLGIESSLFEAHRQILLRGWAKHSDNRLYHQVITEHVQLMLQRRLFGKNRQHKFRNALQSRVSNAVSRVSNAATVEESRVEESRVDTKNRDRLVRATRLPADWQLPEELKDWAVKVHHLDPQHVVRISLAFRDFWIGKPGAGGCKLDWAATWRNWIRKECERAGLSQLR